MEKIRCLVIDDEELARDLLQSYIEKIGLLELVGSYENALEALRQLKSDKVDLIFLDIQMPEIKGTEFAKTLTAETNIIFTTAYSEYALEGFELNAKDYLLKPITFERFLKAVNRLKLVGASNDPTTTITVKSGYDLHKLRFEDIIYIVSESEYVIYFTPKGKIMSNQSLKKLEKLLPESLFLRVHRSYIVNKKKVKALKGRELYMDVVSIPVSDTYFDLVKKELF